jgi:NADH-quinone oxidoreductase subunit D
MWEFYHYPWLSIMAVRGLYCECSGLRWDLRKVDGYSVYPELDFDIPMGEGLVGTVGDCWDRNYVRVLECWESVKIIEQCVEKLLGEHRRTPDFDPQAMV